MEQIIYWLCKCQWCQYLFKNRNDISDKGLLHVDDKCLALYAFPFGIWSLLPWLAMLLDFVKKILYTYIGDE